MTSTYLQVLIFVFPHLFIIFLGVAGGSPKETKQAGVPWRGTSKWTRILAEKKTEQMDFNMWVISDNPIPNKMTLTSETSCVMCVVLVLYKTTTRWCASHIKDRWRWHFPISTAKMQTPIWHKCQIEVQKVKPATGCLYPLVHSFKSSFTGQLSLEDLYFGRRFGTFVVRT